MRFKDKRVQEEYDRLSAQLEELTLDREVLNRKIRWRATRLFAMVARTRCKRVRGCRGEAGHLGAHLV